MCIVLKALVKSFRSVTHCVGSLHDNPHNQCEVILEGFNMVQEHTANMVCSLMLLGEALLLGPAVLTDT